jgi:hypothetical protein
MVATRERHRAAACPLARAAWAGPPRPGASGRIQLLPGCAVRTGLQQGGGLRHQARARVTRHATARVARVSRHGTLAVPRTPPPAPPSAAASRGCGRAGGPMPRSGTPAWSTPAASGQPRSSMTPCPSSRTPLRAAERSPPSTRPASRPAAAGCRSRSPRLKTPPYSPAVAVGARGSRPPRTARRQRDAARRSRHGRAVDAAAGGAAWRAGSRTRQRCPSSRQPIHNAFWWTRAPPRDVADDGHSATWLAMQGHPPASAAGGLGRRRVAAGAAHAVPAALRANQPQRPTAAAQRRPAAGAGGPRHGADGVAAALVAVRGLV